MAEKLLIDRNFLFLHGERLAVFAERVFRDCASSPYVPVNEILCHELEEAANGLRNTLDNPELKRKARTEALREREATVLITLNRLADYVERFAPCKSDVFTTGFRPQSEQRRPVSVSHKTRRQQRMTAKMEKIQNEAVGA